MKKTVREILEAGKKNGYPWGQGWGYEDTTGTSCYLGQVLRNLGVSPIYKDTPPRSRFEDLVFKLDNRLWALFAPTANVVGRAQSRFGFETPSITTFNDNQAASYEEVHTYAKKVLEPYLDLEVEW